MFGLVVSSSSTLGLIVTNGYDWLGVVFKIVGALLPALSGRGSYMGIQLSDKGIPWAERDGYKSRQILQASVWRNS